MGLEKLVKGFLGSDEGKEVLKSAVKAATGKKTSSASSAVSKVAKAATGGFDLSSLVGLATKNADMISVLGNLGALKGVVEPEESKAQALVKKLFTLVKKSTGLKIDEEMFSKIVTKVLSSSTVKAKVEKLAGKTGSLAFIKKAIAAFI